MRESEGVISNCGVVGCGDIVNIVMYMPDIGDCINHCRINDKSHHTVFVCTFTLCSSSLARVGTVEATPQHCARCSATEPAVQRHEWGSSGENIQDLRM